VSKCTVVELSAVSSIRVNIDLPQRPCNSNAVCLLIASWKNSHVQRQSANLPVSLCNIAISKCNVLVSAVKTYVVYMYVCMYSVRREDK